MTQLVEITTDHEVKRAGPWARILGLVERIELFVGGLLILGILVLVMVQVLGRVTPASSPVWTGELAKFCLIWLAFSVSGYLMGREEHITLNVIDHALPELGRKLVHVFSLLVVAATSMAVAYEGYDIFSSGSPIKSPAAGIPLGWIYALPTIGMVLTAIRAVLLAFVPATRPQPLTSPGDAGEQPQAPESKESVL